MKQSLMYILVLGKLYPRKIAPSPNSNANPKPSPDPDWGEGWGGGPFPDTVYFVTFNLTS